MSRVIAVGFAASILLVAVMALGPDRAEAGVAPQTVWLCKPGIDDNPCLDGDLGGTRYLASGQFEPIDYEPASNPRFDCFYVYPTQSQQVGPNADLSRDPELKAVAVNQAAQFSRVCDVYAPVYRQYTLDALDLLDELTVPEIEEIRDTAYFSMKAAFEDFLANQSKGRGFILIGHSQGASHLSRLIDEEIDPNPALRRRMISAIVPGSNNIYVPKGGVVGGNLENIPACTQGDQLGCVMAWSLYLNKSETGLPPNSSFGRLSTGYWVYPEARPDPSNYEVLCVNPAILSNGGSGGAGGDAGLLTPLANLPAFTGNLNRPKPWTEGQGLYQAECQTGEDASWLDMTKVPGASGSLIDGILPLINSNAGGLHTGDVNLALGDLIEIASNQGTRYLSWQDAVAKARSVSRRAASQARKSERLFSTIGRASKVCRGNQGPAICRNRARTRAQAVKARTEAKRLSARAKVLAEEAEAIYDPPVLCPAVSPRTGEGAEGARPGLRVC